MILDTLEHLSDYTPLCPALKAVATFLQTHNLATLRDGRYELEAEGAFVNVQTVAPKAADKALLETHREMIDVQVPTADETIGISPLITLSNAPFDENRDVAFHDERPMSYVNLKNGMFAIFFPQDGHAPGITPTPLHKAIFKLPIKY